MAIFSAISAIAGWISSTVYIGAMNLGLVNAAGTIGSIAGKLATALIATGIQRALVPKVNIPTSEVQATINQEDAARRVYIGRNLAGGIRAMFDTKGGKLYQPIVVQHGALTAFDEFWIDGEPATLDEDGAVVAGEKSGYVTVETRLGDGPGGDYATLAVFSYWNAARRLEDQATFLVTASAPRGNDFMKVFPKASQTAFQWVIRGQAVHDPRTGTVGYSENAALGIAHYLTHSGGYRLDDADMHWASVEAMADWCDVAMPQLAGGTAPTSSLCGYWSMDEEPSQVLARMNTACGIRAYETEDGRIGLIGGSFGDPACTITTKDIRSIRTSSAISEREGFNTLRVWFMSADHRFSMTEVDPWIDQARVDTEGEISQEFRPDMCPNLSQARRLAKRSMHDSNRAKVEIVTNLVGLKARYPKQHGQRHTILLDYRPEDGSGREIIGEYEVMDHEFNPISLECRIELARVDRASDAWEPEEEGTLPAPLPGRDSDEAPELHAVVSQRTEQLGGILGLFATLFVEATPVVGRDDLTIAARYRQVGTSQWTAMSAEGLTATSAIVSDRRAYEVEARWQGSFTGVAAWVSLGTIMVTANATPPGAPTELIASPGAGSAYVHLSWRNPAEEFAELRIYRGTTATVGDAGLIATTGGAAGQLSEVQDHTAAASVPYWYWVRAVNSSGIEGATAGPATITL